MLGLTLALEPTSSLATLFQNVLALISLQFGLFVNTNSFLQQERFQGYKRGTKIMKSQEKKVENGRYLTLGVTSLLRSRIVQLYKGLTFLLS